MCYFYAEREIDTETFRKVVEQQKAMQVKRAKEAEEKKRKQPQE